MTDPAWRRPIRVVVENLDGHACLQAEALCDGLGALLDRVMSELDVAAEVEMALVLCDDATLHRLNRDHRGIDRPTDVLSFPVDPADIPAGETANLGDVLISLPYAARSAERQGQTLEDELRLLAVHGLLHLLGHEDESEEGAERMRRLETQLGLRPAGA